MKGFLVNVNEKTAGAVEFEAGLDNYYRLLDCDCIDIVTRTVDGREFDIICDDEALLKDSPVPSAIGKHGQAVLFGNLLIVHHDEEGNTVGLSDDDVKALTAATSIYLGLRYWLPYPMLHLFDY